MKEAEQAEQEALAQWLSWKPMLVWCHVPNGGARHIRVAKQMKAAGVKAGVPDILIFSRPPKQPDARGVAIELKAAKQQGRAAGRLSDAQQKWLKALADCGWACRVCFGADEAVQWLTALGY